MDSLCQCVKTYRDFPRLQSSHPIFDADEPLPAEFIISVTDTEVAFQKPWVLKDSYHLLAAPVTAIFNSSLREGVLPKLWKSATVIPLSKKHPPDTVENDIRPISLTPILAKLFESLVLKWVDICVKPQIDDRQFGVWQGLVLVLMFWLKCSTNGMKPQM